MMIEFVNALVTITTMFTSSMDMRFTYQTSNSMVWWTSNISSKRFKLEWAYPFLIKSFSYSIQGSTGLIFAILRANRKTALKSAKWVTVHPVTISFELENSKIHTVTKIL